MTTIKLNNNKNLSPGESILRKDLHKYLGGSGQGGINPSNKSSSILFLLILRKELSTDIMMDGIIIFLSILDRV